LEEKMVEKSIKGVLIIMIEIMIEYLNQLPKTTYENFEKQRCRINKLERIKKELRNEV